MGVKISELEEYTNIKDIDILPIVDVTNEGTKRITFANFKKPIFEIISKIQEEQEIKSNIISVGFNSNFSMTSSNWEQKDLTFDKVISQVGSKFSLVNGKVKIGTGITKVKASLQAGVNGLAENTFYDIAIMKNSTSIARCSGKREGDPQSWSFSISPILLEVTEGDLISANCFVNSATFVGDSATQLVIEAIDYD